MRSIITGRTLAIGVVAALVGVALGVAVVVTGRSATRDETVLAAMGGGSEVAATPSATAPGPVATSPGAGAGGAASEPADAATEASDAVAAGAGDDAEVAALVPLCAAATARRDDAVRAAQVALGGWKTHYGAQLALDRGEISSDEAGRRWAASKEPAQRNLDALAAATDAIGSDAPCGELADDGAAAGPTADAVEACLTRAELATGALDAAQEPLQAWHDHLQMMASKERYTTDEYLQVWDRMVGAAPDEMRGFDRAVAEWRDAPACEPAA